MIEFEILFDLLVMKGLRMLNFSCYCGSVKYGGLEMIYCVIYIEFWVSGLKDGVVEDELCDSIGMLMYVWICEGCL